jgi:hypothetical protein
MGVSLEPSQQAVPFAPLFYVDCWYSQKSACSYKDPCGAILQDTLVCYGISIFHAGATFLHLTRALQATSMHPLAFYVCFASLFSSRCASS